MYPILFKKDRAEELVARIGEGREIPAPPGGWNSDELLQVAGALFFAAMSHGPPAIDPERSARQGENGNVTTRSLADDLHMAIDFYSDLTMMVCGGTYEERFEPELRAVVVREGNERGFRVLKGGKAT